MLSCVSLLAVAGLLRVSPVAQSATGAFANSAAINISDADGGGAGTGYAYPSAITVSGLSGTITDVNVTLNGLTHTWPDDIGLLLVGPSGQNIVLQSDAGGSADVSGVTYTFDDQAASTIPDSGPLASGTYKPTSIVNDEKFPTYNGNPAPPTSWNQPAPAGSSTLNGIFGGTNPNGVWKLYIVDAFAGDTGGYAGGWSINITTNSSSSAATEPATTIDNGLTTDATNAVEASYTNSTAVTFVDATTYDVGVASPYPTSLSVSGLAGTITDINVRLNGVTHTTPDDIGLLLVGPTGQHIILQTDVGGIIPVSNVTYTFDDQAAAGIPNSGPIAAGSYKPTSVADDDRFPTTTGAPSQPFNQPAPAGSSTLNGIFGGTSPNGTWRLYAVDSFNGGAGAINGGWSLEITTNATSPATNSIDDAQFFVTQHYSDFLNRAPDSGGLQYWSEQIAGNNTNTPAPCAAGDAGCVLNRRVNVSAAFFVENEFQFTGYFVYRMYASSLGRQPTYAEFTSDRGQIDYSNLAASKQTFADAWVLRQEFINKYGSNPAAETFVDALLATLRNYDGVDLTAKRSTYIGELQGGATRGQIVKEVSEDAAVQSAEYNPAFVLMQYFGYLRRDADTGGYQFWLNILNNRVPNNYKAMVCAFLTSTEYQLRFGGTATHTNQDCSAVQ